MANLPQTGSTSIALTTLQSPLTGQGFDLWGSVTINGIQYKCPDDGYFVVKGALDYRWDVQNGLMLQGAQQFFRGVNPSDLTLECSFWAESQYESFIEILAGFQYNLKNIIKSGANVLGQLIVRAVNIYHPALDLIGINQVNVVNVGAPEQTSDDHMWKSTIKLRQYFPPIALPPQDKDTAPQDPKDPLDPSLQNKATQVQDLTNQAKTLTWINPTS
jgi:hypothetical protein